MHSNGIALSEIPWGFGGVGYLTYKRTYARTVEGEQTEEFPQTIDRILDACDEQLGVGFNDIERADLRKMMLQLKCSVAGRFLWQLGTRTVGQLGLMSLQNCFSGETTFWTKQGIRRFDDFNDNDSVVIRGRDRWLPATIKKFGVQPVVSLTVRRGRQVMSYQTTAGHRWILTDNSVVTTNQLQPGMKLKSFHKRTNFNYLFPCPIGIQHGLVFGDGHYSDQAKACAVVVCKGKEEIRQFFSAPTRNNREITGLPSTWKDLPPLEMNKHYLLGFLAGWFAADGSVGLHTGTLRLSSANQQLLQWARSAFSLLCITTSEINLRRERSPYSGEIAPLYEITIDRTHLPEGFLLRSKHRDRAKELTQHYQWTVESITPTDNDIPVYCVVEPEHEEFTLANGILTKNCAFVTIDSPIRPFTWMFDALMLGSGVGYNIQREYVYQLPKVKAATIVRQDSNDADLIVSDSREGWVRLLDAVLRAHFETGKGFSYSTVCIRSAGTPIKGFGGIASGPESLCWGIEEISKILNSRAGKKLRPVDCLDIANIIAEVVVSGNVRRSAQIAIGDYDDILYLRSKRWDLGPVPKWRSNSNNSVVCNDINSLPEEIWNGYRGNGEPFGFINLRLSRSCGRLGETSYPDPDVNGYNPCAEQSLADFETCCLAEIFLPKVTSKEELQKIARYLYRINKHSLALPCHHPETQAIVHKNMRMGIGVSGYLQATPEQRSWLRSTYEDLREFDRRYSLEHGWPISIKLTTVKPSGTLSLLAGVSPGVHPGYSRYFIRRIRISAGSPLLEKCRANGYHVEPMKRFDGTTDQATMVVSFPCEYPEGTSFAGDMSAIEQLQHVKDLQTNWSDNSVSCTVYYRKEELPAIQEWLKQNYNDGVKSVSFLLHSDHGFAQAPYEEITEEQYRSMCSTLIPISSIEIGEDEMELSECISGACPIK